MNGLSFEELFKKKCLKIKVDAKNLSIQFNLKCFFYIKNMRPNNFKSISKNNFRLTKSILFSGFLKIFLVF